MYKLYIDWMTTVSCGATTTLEKGEFPLILRAESYEEARMKALQIAQGMARAFDDTEVIFYYRILK